MSKPNLTEILRREARIRQLEHLLPLQIWNIKHIHPANCNYEGMEKRVKELSREYKELTGRHYSYNDQRRYP